MNAVPLPSGQIHVIPSGMFNFADPRRDYSVKAKLLDEYAEELFGRQEPPPSLDPQLQYLVELVSTGHAELLLTGVAVDLLNLRPEVCALLVIHTPEWLHRVTTQRQWLIRINDEFLPDSADQDADLLPVHGFTGTVRLAGDAAMIQEGSLLPECMTPPGAAAFWMGVDLLRRRVRPIP